MIFHEIAWKMESGKRAKPLQTLSEITFFILPNFPY